MNLSTMHSSEERKNEGGFNKETIMLNINTFKKFCLKADTQKADQVHDYYIKLEELLQETVNEERDDNIKYKV
jgi:phage anti-repressor protein